MAPIQDLLGKYRHQGVLIDANLIVLHVVGCVDTELIRSHKRTRDRGYGEDEFVLLQLLLEGFVRRVATPSILAEASNLAGQTGGALRQRCLDLLGQEIERIEERYDPSRELASTEVFSDLGLADCSVLRAADQGYLVLTDDAKLQIALAVAGKDCLHFTHLREWLQP